MSVFICLCIYNILFARERPLPTLIFFNEFEKNCFAIETDSVKVKRERYIDIKFCRN